MRMGLSAIAPLTLGALLAGAAPSIPQTSKSQIEKAANVQSDSVEEKVRRSLNDDALEDEDSIRALFGLGDEAVPPLIRFLSDPDNGTRAGAARGLAYIGNEKGMEALRIAVRTERNKETRSAISCFLAGGLVETESEADLHFLRRSVESARLADDNEKSFGGLCAGLALGMKGRSDSLPILRKFAGADLVDSEEIGKTILWIERKFPSRQAITTRGANDEDLIKTFVLDNTFFAENERDKTSVDNVTFNRARNKVLVSLEIYLNPKSARGYDLVLAKVNGVWRVMGIWFAWVA
jgi:HEAT repeats